MAMFTALECSQDRQRVGWYILTKEVINDRNRDRVGSCNATCKGTTLAAAQVMGRGRQPYNKLIGADVWRCGLARFGTWRSALGGVVSCCGPIIYIVS